jgi:hypothetical protein
MLLFLLLSWHSSRLSWHSSWLSLGIYPLHHRIEHIFQLSLPLLVLLLSSFQMLLQPRYLFVHRRFKRLTFISCKLVFEFLIFQCILYRIHQILELVLSLHSSLCLFVFTLILLSLLNQSLNIVF